MNTDNPIPLPDEYRLDIAKATRSLEALAEREPDAPILLTLAQFGAGGLEAESDIRLPAEQAAALLSTIGEDQRVQVGSLDLVLLRVGRTEELPPRETEMVRERILE
jgi:hypothetical protein